jgi:hypothetical protein
VGQVETLTATVTPQTGTKNARRIVTCFDGTSELGSAPLDTGGHASLPESLAAGTHQLSAVYGGDPTDKPSPSQPVQLVVNAPAASDGPRVTSVKRYGFHLQPTVVVLTFNEALDPARAQNPNNYVFVTLGGPGRGGLRIGHVIRVSRAVYDPATNSVFLYPAERLDIHNFYRLTVNGTAPNGLTDTAGNLLDGKGDGKPGSNFVTVISRKTLVGADRLLSSAARQVSLKPATHEASRHVAAVAVDALMESGHVLVDRRLTFRRHRSG